MNERVLEVRPDRDLWLFLAPRRRRGRFAVVWDGTASLGHVVQTIGIPLTEVGALRLDGGAVGWVHVVLAEYVDAEAFVVIGGLVVDRARRRLGIGRALMDRAETWARERGCSMVRLTSSAARKAAHRFYEDLGYTNIKTQYSFVKALDTAAAARAGRFVPRVDPAS